MCCFFPHRLIARVQDFSWPKVGFFGGYPLLKCRQHYTAVNKITAYALTLISSVTVSSKLIPSVNVFLTKPCTAKKPKDKCYKRESNHILTFPEVLNILSLNKFKLTCTDILHNHLYLPAWRLCPLCSFRDPEAAMTEEAPVSKEIHIKSKHLLLLLDICCASAVLVNVSEASRKITISILSLCHL